MPTAIVTRNGHVTIPIEVRKALGLQPGSRVAFVPTSAGSYELVPETRTVRTLKGSVARSSPAVSLDEMGEAVTNAATENLDL